MSTGGADTPQRSRGAAGVLRLTEPKMAGGK